MAASISCTVLIWWKLAHLPVGENRNCSTISLARPPRLCFILSSVKLWATSARRRQGSRLAAVAVMLSLWVVMCVLGVSPGLHHLLHKDALDPGHNCLVTQFQNHSVLSGFVSTLAPAMPEVSSVLASRGGFEFHPSYDYRLSPSRAPPAV